MKPAGQKFQAKNKFVKVLLSALPILFCFAATRVFAAADNRPADLAASPGLVAKLQTGNKADRKIDPPADAARCAATEQAGKSPAEVASGGIDKKSVASDIRRVEDSSADDRSGDPSVNGADQDLVKDKLHLSLGIRSAKIDVPQTCSPANAPE